MIYFDAAATTLEKPPCVVQAVQEAMRTMTSPGRGGHRGTRAAEETVYRCRTEAADLFGVDTPEKVVFTFNATHGLNIAIRSLVKPGSRVIISGYEHNAVTRPLSAIDGVEIVVIDTPLFAQKLAEEEFCTAIRQGADVVICNHVSNVFGFVQPLEKIAAVCRETNTPLIVDASQSAGVLPVRMDALGAAFIAMPGHKGLYGPQGTGLLLCGEYPTSPLLAGGTGSLSRQQMMPESLPERLEAGTHNVPGIAGLLCGIRFVKANGLPEIAGHHRRLISHLVHQLRCIPGVVVYGAEKEKDQGGVVSFTIQDCDCQEVGEMLAEKGVAVRAGLHCAPLAHKTGGTLGTGTIRLSVSLFNNLRQTEKVTGVLREIIGKMVKK